MNTNSDRDVKNDSTIKISSNMPGETSCPAAMLAKPLAS